MFQPQQPLLIDWTVHRVAAGARVFAPRPPRGAAHLQVGQRAQPTTARTALSAAAGRFFGRLRPSDVTARVRTGRPRAATGFGRLGWPPHQADAARATMSQFE